MPYPPLTFLVQALLIRLAGPHYLVQIIYAVGVNAAATGLAYWIVHRVVRDWRLAALLFLPLTVFGVYGIFPPPFFDPDPTLAMLLSIPAALSASFRTGRPRSAPAPPPLPLPILAHPHT